MTAFPQSSRHRAEFAMICLIVLRKLVGELRNEHVGDVFCALCESYSWRGYSSLPQPLLLTVALIPGDVGHPLRDMGTRPLSCTAAAVGAQQGFFRICYNDCSYSWRVKCSTCVRERPSPLMRPSAIGATLSTCCVCVCVCVTEASATPRLCHGLFVP
jgi:hypothetical protein